jgi:very-short-patch-repair endonuclease
MVNGTITKNQAQKIVDQLTKKIKTLAIDGRVYTFDSPIEETMYQAMLKCFSEYIDIADNVQILPQLEVGNYRLDFAILANKNGQKIKLAIECDGFEFHSRTPKQATHDKRRDRILAIAGYTVLRQVKKLMKIQMLVLLI